MTSGRPVGPELEAQTARRIVVVGIVALTAARLVYAAAVGLMPQEAYYWGYAMHPALSYLDHPPMVAWWIRAGTAILGHHVLGVRLLGVLSSAALTAILYRLGERLFSPLAGLLAAGAANATVLFGIGAVVITPDVPLTFFWAAALLPACELLLEDGKGPGRLAWRWYLLGLLAGGAYLSKYTAALLPLGLLAAALVLPRGRKALGTPHPWLAVALSLFVFSPVLLWNADHHFVSFAFQTARRADAGAEEGLRVALLWQYLGTQAMVVTPVLYGGLVAALVVAGRRARRGDGRLRLLVLVTAPGLVLFALVSPFVWVKLNWVGPVYLGGLVALCGLVAGAWDRRWIRRTTALGMGLGAALAVFVHVLPLAPAIPLPVRADLWDGWASTAAQIEADLPHLHPDTFVIGWDYKTAAELAWYLPPGVTVTGGNAIGGHGRAFRYWFDPARHAGATALVVTDLRQALRDPPGYLRRFCSRVRPLLPILGVRGKQHLTVFHIWRCDGYRPPAAGDPLNRS